MCFVAMLECSTLVSCCILDGIVLLIVGLCHYCFACHLQTVHPITVIFISIWPKSSHLFSGTLGLPSWGLVQSFPSGARICIAYHIPHSISSLHRVAWVCTWLIVSLLLVCLVWVEQGDEFANEEPVEFAFEDPVNSDNCAGKMIIPSKSLLSLLCQFARSLAMPLLRCLPLACKPPKLPCQTSNPPLS